MVAQEAKESIDKPAKFTVYNARRDELRSINVTPSLSWGGGGLLGTDRINACLFSQDAAYGLLPLNEPPILSGMS